MMHRFSSHFKKRKEGRAATDDKKVNGLTNNVYETNGAVAAGKSTDGPSTNPDGKVNHTASRAEVESSFNAFANLVHAAQRPLPNQSGDGTYLDDQAEHSSLWADVKSLGYKDAKTLMEVMKTTASGADVDDKTMLMERIVQVSYSLNNEAMASDLKGLNSSSPHCLLHQRHDQISRMPLSTSYGVPSSIRLSPS